MAERETATITDRLQRATQVRPEILPHGVHGTRMCTQQIRVSRLAQSLGARIASDSSSIVASLAATT